MPGPRRPAAGPLPADGVGISRGLNLFIAFACGLIVADNYYVQPLLPRLCAYFHAPSQLVGLCFTGNQLGYAAGLLLLVPLGDILSRRRLIPAMLALDSLALFGAAVAPGVWTLIAALTVVGVVGTAINILIPLVATVATARQRGRAVGTVMTGLLLGILLARTVSGALAQAAGWRAVYLGAGGAIALLAVALGRLLPEPPVAEGRSYRRLLGSVADLVRQEPFLRRRMAVGLLGFCVFQLLWTSLPFLLSQAPFGYSTAEIGLFGLLGAAGALAAQPAGRLANGPLAHRATGICLALVAAAWALLSRHTALGAIIAGLIVLDVGVQGAHVMNQTRILSYPLQIRSRVTTAYMTAYFLGGSLGGALATQLFSLWGWDGVCAVGLAATVAALALWATERVREPDPALELG